MQSTQSDTNGTDRRYSNALPFIGRAGRRTPLCAEDENAAVFESAALDGHVVAVKRAKDICSHCPLLEPCKLYALATNQRWSVWGGLSERTRIAHWRKFGREHARREYRDWLRRNGFEPDDAA